MQVGRSRNILNFSSYSTTFFPDVNRTEGRAELQYDQFMFGLYPMSLGQISLVVWVLKKFAV